MALRLIEVSVATQDVDRVLGLARESPGATVWPSAAHPDATLIRILVEAEHAEAVSDALVRDLGGLTAGFRLVLLPVEATVPPLAEPPARPPASEPAGGGIERISREELYEDLAQAARLTPVFVVTVVLSTVVAAVGLLRGDVAVVIGAMVIAPLLGPNVALSLASTLGDPALARRSLQTIAVGVAVALALSVALGAALHVSPTAPELAPRTHVDLADVALALAAGAAGSLAFTTGVPAVVVGVMVAVALLPPLVVTGLMLGSGHGREALGAGLLVLTNVVCINLAAIVTFLVQRVRPRTWWEADRATRATRIAVVTWLALLALLVGVMVLRRRFGLP